MAYSAHSHNNSNSYSNTKLENSFYGRTRVSNSRHASPEAELDEQTHTASNPAGAGRASDPGSASASGGEGRGVGGGNSIVAGYTGDSRVAFPSIEDSLSSYDGGVPLFSGPNLNSSSVNHKRFSSSPYGTPSANGQTTSSTSYLPSMLVGAAAQQGPRSPFSSYLQPQALVTRGQPSSSMPVMTSYSNIQTPAISPAYLQQQRPQSASVVSGVTATHHPSGPSPEATTSKQRLSTSLHSLRDDEAHNDTEEDEDEGDEDDGEDDDDLENIEDGQGGEDDEEYDDMGGEGGGEVVASDVAGQSQLAELKARKVAKNGIATHGKRRRKADVAGRVAVSKKLKGDASNASDRKGITKSQVQQRASDADKSKSTRGSKACTVCRRLKMRCEPSADDEEKCKRCRAGGHECVFEESQRGRRKNQKTDAMAKSIRNMENTLETVLKAIAAGNAHTVVGMSLGADGNLVAPITDQQNVPAQHPIGAQDDSSQYTQTQMQMPPPPPPPQLPTAPDAQQASQDETGHYITGPSHHFNSSSGDAHSRVGHLAPFDFSIPTSSTSGSVASMFTSKVEDTTLGNVHSGPSPALRLHTLPEPENTWAPLGLLAEASLENNQTKKRRNTFNETQLPHNLSAMEEIQVNQARALSNGNDRDESNNSPSGKLGVANDAYFQPGPFNSLPLRQLMIEKNLPSPLLTEKIITVEEAVFLFNLYHHECSMFTAQFLLEDWHTPINVSSRSTFLFTTICAVASKFYQKRPELYGLCMPYARKLASDMIERGFKSVEIVQAYMLLAYWNTPTERYEDDRTWTYIGLAVRMAVELNLWRNPKQPTDLDEEGVASFAMEANNRERTWYQIFIMDRSIAIQTGRPHSLRVGAFERNVRKWSQLPTARATDAGLAAIVELFRITSGFQDLLQLSCFERPDLAELSDYAIITRSIDNALENWNAEWPGHLLGKASGRQLAFTAAMKDFYYHYHRLLAYSFALQQILKVSNNSLEILPYFLPSYESASEVLTVVRTKLHSLGHLRYAPDLVFINTSYAAVFLLKLLRPEMTDFTDTERILSQVEQIVETMEACSVDSVHTPALYAGFLRVLLAAKRGKDSEKDQHIKLDPALASKLSETNPQNQGMSATLATSAAPRPEVFVDNSGTVGPTLFAQDLAGTFSRPNGAGGINTSAFMSGEPSNQASGGFWNLDQLGQAGFWENLSMPGLGSPPTYGLSGGHLFQGDPWPFSTPNSASASRTNSPKASALAQFGVATPNLPLL